MRTDPGLAQLTCDQDMAGYLFAPWLRDYHPVLSQLRNIDLRLTERRIDPGAAGLVNVTFSIARQREVALGSCRSLSCRSLPHPQLRLVCALLLLLTFVSTDLVCQAALLPIPALLITCPPF